MYMKSLVSVMALAIGSCSLSASNENANPDSLPDYKTKLSDAYNGLMFTDVKNDKVKKEKWTQAVDKRFELKNIELGSIVDQLERFFAPLSRKGDDRDREIANTVCDWAIKRYNRAGYISEIFAGSKGEKKVVNNGMRDAPPKAGRHTKILFDIIGLNKNLKKIEQDIESLPQKQKDLSDTSKSKQEEANKLNLQVEDIKTKFAAKEIELKVIGEKEESLSGEQNDKKAKLNENNSQLIGLKDNLSKLQTQKKQLESELVQLKDIQKSEAVVATVSSPTETTENKDVVSEQTSVVQPDVNDDQTKENEEKQIKSTEEGAESQVSDTQNSETVDVTVTSPTETVENVEVDSEQAPSVPSDVNDEQAKENEEKQKANEEKLEELQEQLDTVEPQIAELETKIKSLQSNRSHLNQFIQEIAKHITDLEKDSKPVNEELAQLEKQRDDAESQIVTLEKEVAAKELEIKNLPQMKSELEANVVKMKLQVQELQDLADLYALMKYLTFLNVYAALPTDDGNLHGYDKDHNLQVINPEGQLLLMQSINKLLALAAQKPVIEAVDREVRNAMDNYPAKDAIQYIRAKSHIDSDYVSSSEKALKDYSKSEDALNLIKSSYQFTNPEIESSELHKQTQANRADLLIKRDMLKWRKKITDSKGSLMHKFALDTALFNADLAVAQHPITVSLKAINSDLASNREKIEGILKDCKNVWSLCLMQLRASFFDSLMKDKNDIIKRRLDPIFDFLESKEKYKLAKDNSEKVLPCVAFKQDQPIQYAMLKTVSYLNMYNGLTRDENGAKLTTLVKIDPALPETNIPIRLDQVVGVKALKWMGRLPKLDNNNKDFINDHALNAWMLDEIKF